MSSPSKSFEVAIVRGGVCGLTCAISLAKNGIHAEIYEAAVGTSTNKSGVDTDSLSFRPASQRLVQAWDLVS